MNSYRNRENSGIFSHGRLWSVLVALVALCAFFVLLSPPAFAQEGAISGAVRDASGAVVPGASVTITNTATGVTTPTQTNAEGLYTFPYVKPGVYDLTVSVPGFQTLKKPGITVNVTERVQVNFDLNVGKVEQTVEVTGATPLLTTTEATTGQTIDRRFVNDLPLLNRTALDLAYLAPGISQPPNSTYATTTQTSTTSYQGANNFVSNGSRNQTSDTLIDGVTAGQVQASGLWLQSAYTPSVDAVQEFKVQQTNFSAEYGFTGSTIVNLVTRSGSSSFHGSAYDFLRNNVLDSQNFFNNQSTDPAVHDIPHLARNVFGGTFGGPIHKDKTFFFFDYEGTRQSTMAPPANAGVPSAAEKTGDFGEFCGQNGGTYNSAGQCSAASGQLWDPYTGVNVPGVGTPRSSFIPFNNMATYASPGTNLVPGQKLPGGPVNTPGNLLDPSMMKLFQYFPAPNRNVGQPDYNPYFNWVGSGANKYNNDQWDLKIDQIFNDRNTLSARFSRQKTTAVPQNCFNNAADPCTFFAGDHTGHLFSLQFTHTFSPTTVLSFSYGLTRTADNDQGVSAFYSTSETDPVSVLGMPSYINTSGVKTFPTVISYGNELAASTNNSTAIGSSPWAYLRQGQETHDFLVSLTHMRGRHELKFGGEFRMHRFNAGQPGTPNGLFAFGPAGTSQTGNWDGSGGDTLADMLIGSGGNWGQYEIPAFLATQNFAWAGYAQDAFRVSPKLTVNVGLRYDLTMPQTERWNRLSWIDPDAPSPLLGSDGQAIPGYNLKGGLKFASPDQRTSMDTDYRDIQPRFGIAYSLNNKTVIRTGYGIYYAVSSSVAGANAISPNAPGFYAPTAWQTAVPGYPATPPPGLSDPFPFGLVPVTGSSLGMLTNISAGQTVDYFRTMNHTPYEQSWSFGIQRQLPGNMLLETNYVGKKGTHIYYGNAGDFDINHLGPEVEQHIGDKAWNVAMQTQVPNPFYHAGATQGVIQQGNLLAPTVAQWTLLRPYPQFQGLDFQGPPWSNSSYQALQLRLEKRFSNGLQLLATYVWSKTIDEASGSGNGFPAIGVVDPNNRKLDRGISQYDIPHVIQISYVYQLPFGRGKPFGANMNPVLDTIIGGWQTTGIWRFDNGQPLLLSLSANNQPLPTYGQRPDLTGTPQLNPKDKWLLPLDQGGGYFANPEVFQVPAAYTIGTAPRALPWINVPGTSNANLSLFKDFSLKRVREGMRLQFRTEWFNAFNHPQFAGPNASVGQTGATGFGAITSQANLPRSIQMALKLYF